jgi:subtilisin family serine protease
MRLAIIAAAIALLGPLAGASGSVPAPPPDPTDPIYASEDWLARVGWSVAIADESRAYATIGIADSGVAVNSDDFSGFVWPDSADCETGHAIAASTPTVVDDTLGHGTVVASLAAAPINGFGMVGVSPWADLIFARFTADAFDLSHASCAIDWLVPAARNGPLVANLSFGASSSTPISRSTAALVRAGALVVAAVGNRSVTPGFAPLRAASSILVPARDPHTLAVGDMGGRIELRGPQLDIVAPGTDMVVPTATGFTSITYPQGGTSYAAAIVSGAASLVWGYEPQVTNPQVVAYQLRMGARRALAPAKGRWTAVDGFGSLWIPGALAIAPPADGEYEPNDSAATAARSTCPAHGACRISGIVVSTDDPADYWRVGRFRCPARLRHPAAVRLSCTRIGSSSRLRVTLARGRSIAAYTITLRAR